MKKKLVVILLIVGCNLVWIAMLSSSLNPFAWFQWSSFDKKDQISVALVGPMTGDGFMNGRDMVRGARMAIFDAVAAGQLSNKEILLNFFDDKNDVSAAVQAASEITINNQAVAVLGHFLSTTTLAAGAIYQKSRIPMITGSATAENITDKNPWAFGTIPDNFDQAISIISQIINQNRPVSIIHETGEYYDSLSREIMSSAAEAGIKVLNIWEIKEDSKNDGLDEILRELKAIQDPGIIIIAAQSRKAAAIIRSINNPSTDFTIIGTNTFATASFYNSLTSLPREKAKPGYYLNGIYGTTPFLPELRGLEANRFVENYRTRFGESPGWVAAGYYDAMKVLIEAIELEHINGREVREDRALIRAVLSSFTDQEQAVKGVSGEVFFDKNGRVERLYGMGYYENHHFRPAFSQYHVIAEKKHNGSKKFLDWRGTVVGDRLLGKKNLVFAGMDLISVDNLNSSTGEFFVNFYIWFRFKGDFNEQQIVFENAENPILLEQPILETRQDDFTIRSYEVKAKFKQTMTYDNFPFEKHGLTIRFHHKFQTDQKLIFIPDYLSMRTYLSPKPRQISMENTSSWEVDHVIQSRDTFEKQFSGFKLGYSSYNAQIQTQRIDRLFPLKVLVPLLALILFLYFSLFLPIDHVGSRLFILLPVELVTGICHYYLRTLNPSGTMMRFEVNCYTVYALGILSASVILGRILLGKMDNIKWVILSNRICVGIYFFVITGLIGMNLMNFW